MGGVGICDLYLLVCNIARAVRSDVGDQAAGNRAEKGWLNDMENGDVPLVWITSSTMAVHAAPPGKNSLDYAHPNLLKDHL